MRRESQSRGNRLLCVHQRRRRVAHRGDPAAEVPRPRAAPRRFGGGTKNGLLGAEAVIFLNPLAAVGSAFVRKQVTQLSSKMRFLAAQFNAILDDGLWLELAVHANEMAGELHVRTSCIDGVSFDGPPAVNSVFPSLPRPPSNRCATGASSGTGTRPAIRCAG